MNDKSSNKSHFPATLAQHAIVFITVVLVSFLATGLFISSNLSGSPIEEKRALLEERIKKTEKEREKLKNEIEKLREEISKLEKKATSESEGLKELQERLNDLRFAAGLTAAEGPGVEIVMSDGEVKNDEIVPEAYIVHDSDIRAMVNALYAAGAEAVSINGERISYVTAIRCVGPTILINSKRMSSPFTIKAIGDPESLERGLVADEVAGELISNVFPSYGIKFEVKKKDKVEVPSYSGGISLPYAEVVRSK